MMRIQAFTHKQFILTGITTGVLGFFPGQVIAQSLPIPNPIVAPQRDVLKSNLEAQKPSFSVLSPPRAASLPALQPSNGHEHFEIEITLSDQSNMRTSDDWGTAFPVLTDSNVDESCAPKSRTLDRNWLWSCLTGLNQSSSTLKTVGQFDGDSGRLVAAIESVNTVFYENGYINSGVRILSYTRGPHTGVNAISLELVVGALRECQNTTQALRAEASQLEKYALKRLTEGCHGRAPFNVYVLERNFRRLATDDAITRVNIGLVPVASHHGLVGLSTGAGNGNGIVPARAGQLFMAVSNDRASSIGSVRQSIGGQWRLPMPGIKVFGEIGETGGAADVSGGMLARVGPNWELNLSADRSDAAIIEPELRSLNIRSKTSGASVGVTYHALRCPLAPRFSAPFGQARVTPTRKYSGCVLSTRRSGDLPSGWYAARDLSVRFELNARRTDTSLLGEAFSFSPGAVDGRTDLIVARGVMDWLEAGRFGTRGDLGWSIATRFTVTKGISGSKSELPGLEVPSPQFTTANLQWNVAAELPWPGLVVEARGAVQLANGLLYASERMPLGGSSVRGYEVGTILADEAAYISVQAHRTFSLSNGKRIGKYKDIDLQRFKVGAFVDTGFARNLSLTKPSTGSISSSGLTAAWLPSKALAFEISWANRQNKEIQRSRDTLLDKGLSYRLQFRPLEIF